MVEFSFDFNRDDPRISWHQPTSEERLRRAEQLLGLDLPASFRDFLLHIAEGFWAEIGNALQVYPLLGENSLTTASENLRKHKWIDIDHVVSFGGTGVDGEQWAFFTGVRTRGLEFPVLKIIPNWPKQYVLRYSSFDRFLICELQFLQWHSPIENDDFDPPEELVEHKWEELYRKHDPSFPTRIDDDYALAVTGEELVEQVRSLARLQ